MLRLLALPLFVGAGLGGCGSLTDLDETAETFISPDRFYQNDAQAAIAVNGVYSPLMSWNGWKQPAQHSIMCDDDQVSCESWMGGGLEGQYGGQWYAQGNSVWFGDYRIIERANEVLKYVPASAGVSEGVKRTAVAQARFARAYAYFDLVRRFGAVPLRTEAYVPDAQLGARPRAPIDSVWRQITTDLWQAAPDLPQTFTASHGQGLPRRASAYGLLAKVYMHMAGAEVQGTPLAANRTTYLDSAIHAARQVMQDPTVALEAEYMDLFDVQKQNASREILFAVQGTRTNQGGSNVVAFFGPAGDCSLVGGCGPAGPGFVQLREDFVDSFSPSDKRMRPNYATPWAWTAHARAQGTLSGRDRRVIHRDSIKVLGDQGLLVDTVLVAGSGWAQQCGVNRLFPGFYRVTLRNPSNPSVTTTDTIAIPLAHYSLKYVDRANTGSEYGNGNNFIILRYADVLLLHAEAVNERSGPTGDAIASLNQVRARAGVQPIAVANPAAVSSQVAFREAVRQERAWELYAEFQRRFDTIRYGNYAAAGGPMNRVVTSELTRNFYSSDMPVTPTVCRPRQEFQKLQPIPQAELAANPLLTQNPGW